MEQEDLIIIAFASIFALLMLHSIVFYEAPSERQHEVVVENYYSNLSNPDAELLSHTSPNSTIQKELRNLSKSSSFERQRNILNMTVRNVTVIEGAPSAQYKNPSYYPSTDVVNDPVEGLRNGTLESWQVEIGGGLMGNRTSRFIYNITQPDLSHEKMVLRVEAVKNLENSNEEFLVTLNVHMKLNGSKWLIKDIDTLEEERLERGP